MPLGPGGMAQLEIEENMKKIDLIAAVLGMGLALTPFAALAQDAANQAPEAPATVAPDQQPTREQLTKLFEVMRLRAQMQNLMKTMPTMIQQQIKAQSEEMKSKMPGAKQLTPEQQAAFDKTMNKFMEKAFNIYPVEEMLDDMATIYQRYLTRTDVDAFIAFYQSRAGQHLLDAQPAIMQEYMPLVMKRMQERTKTLTDEMMKDMEELTKSQGASGDAPAPK